MRRRAVGRNVSVMLVLFMALPGLLPASQAAMAAPQPGASITTGYYQTCAIETGQAYCWGPGGEQLGDGRPPSPPVPRPRLTPLVPWPARPSPRSARGMTSRARWIPRAGPTAGARMTAASLVTVTPQVLRNRSPWTPAACWPGRHSPRSALAATTRVPWTPRARRTAGARMRAANSVTAPPPTLTSQSPWTPAAYWRGRRSPSSPAGFVSTCALDASGAAYCWGGNDAGELGDGTTADSAVPVAVDLPGKTLTSITGGVVEPTFCALDSSGSSLLLGFRELWKL